MEKAKIGKETGGKNARGNVGAWKKINIEWKKDIRRREEKCHARRMEGTEATWKRKKKFNSQKDFTKSRQINWVKNQVKIVETSQRENIEKFKKKIRTRVR